MVGCGWPKAKGCASSQGWNNLSEWIQQGTIFQPIFAQSRWVNSKFSCGKASCGGKVASHGGDQDYHAQGKQSCNLEWRSSCGNVLHPKWCGSWLEIHHPWPYDEGKEANDFKLPYMLLISKFIVHFGVDVEGEDDPQPMAIEIYQPLENTRPAYSQFGRMVLN